MRQERLYLAGAWLDGAGDEPVADPYSGRVVARVAQADAELADRAVAASVQGQEEMEGLATWERAEILRGAAAGIEGRRGARGDGRVAALRRSGDVPSPARHGS